MARRPNYRFERIERERAKSAKKEARLQAKKDRKDLKSPEEAAGDGVEADGPPGTDTDTETP